MIRRASVLLLFLTAASPLPASANEGPIVFRSDVSLVRVDAQVVNRDNRTITGLTVDDFILREEGKVQDIRNFSSEAMPVDIVLLLDVSGSMQPHVSRVSSAAHQALRVLGEDDRVAVLVFDRATRVRLPFRNSRQEIERALDGILRQETFNGGTDITRALLDAADYVARNARRDARRAIVILTDDETERERNEDRVYRALMNADAVLSALIAPDAMARMRRPASGGTPWPTGPMGGPLGGIILGRRGPYGRVPPGRVPPPVVRSSTRSAGTAQIARRSGGDSFRVEEALALEQTLERIRQRYALHFYLPEGASPGRERNIEVDLSAAARRRYPNSEVRYRRSYAAPDGLPHPGTDSESPVVISYDPSVVLPDEPSEQDPDSAPPARASAPATATGADQDGWRRADETTEPGAGAGNHGEPPRGWRRASPEEVAEHQRTRP